MRIISILVMLLVVGAIFVPHTTLAAEAENTNETQTNSKTQENNGLVNGFAYSTPYVLEKSSEEGDNSAEDAEQAQRDVELAKYQGQLNKAVFPEGQFTISATAYTASADECGNSKGLTASGLKVMENRTLACPSQFPFGTKIKIEGYGTYVCEDRGGAIQGNHFDIYMQTKPEAFAFGKKHLLAEVVLN